MAAVFPATAATFPGDRAYAVQDVFPSAVGLDGAQMGVRALHPRPQAAAVYPGWAAADESAVPAAGPWDVREKHRAAARDSQSAADLDFPRAVAAPLVEQGAEPPER